eukprot:3542677-Amphidinium_carterae.1
MSLTVLLVLAYLTALWLQAPFPSKQCTRLLDIGCFRIGSQQITPVDIYQYISKRDIKECCHAASH